MKTLLRKIAVTVLAHLTADDDRREAEIDAAYAQLHDEQGVVVRLTEQHSDDFKKIDALRKDLAQLIGLVKEDNPGADVREWLEAHE